MTLSPPEVPFAFPENQQPNPQSSPFQGKIAVVEGLVQRDGFALHFRIVGEQGPYLILLSGGPGGEVGIMQPIADEMSKICRCVLLEQRGTGRSRLPVYDGTTVGFPAYLDDLEALRLHLRQETLMLLGNSWGMMLALAYGGAYPDRARAIVTLGSGPITDEYGAAVRDNIRCRLSLDEREKLDQLVARRDEDPQRIANEITRTILPAYFYDRKLAHSFIASMPTEVMNSQVPRASLQAAPGLPLETFVRDKLPEITAPVLLVQGRQDIVPEQSILEAHRLIPGSQLHILERCGHLPWVEQPKQTWQLVHAFLEPLLRGNAE